MTDEAAQQSKISDGHARFITRTEELAYELKIKEAMTREIKVVTPTMPMIEVLNLFREARISGAPVVLNGELLGIISIEDLIRALRDSGRRELAVPVADYMTTKVITIKADDPIIEAFKLFAKTKVGRLVVVDENGKLAGMLTKGDLNRGLLNALQSDYQAEEVRRYRASHLFQDINSDRTSLILRYKIAPGDFVHGGTASSQIKQALLRLGAEPQVTRRCAIAIYEAEMNLIIHTTHGGEIHVEIEPDHIVMQTIDDGPGIEDINLVMQPGYSTASEEVRELGFGAGMGLKNIERCVDEMKLQSTPGVGTRLILTIGLQPQKFTNSNQSQ